MFSVTDSRMQHKYRLKLVDNELVLLNSLKHGTEITCCRLSPSDAQYLNCQPVRFNSLWKCHFNQRVLYVLWQWCEKKMDEAICEAVPAGFHVSFSAQSVVFFHPGATRPKQWYENLLLVEWANTLFCCSPACRCPFLGRYWLPRMSLNQPRSPGQRAAVPQQQAVLAVWESVSLLHCSVSYGKDRAAIVLQFLRLFFFPFSFFPLDGSQFEWARSQKLLLLAKGRCAE